VRSVPTSFGPLTYSLDARTGSVRISLEVPRSTRLEELRLRLRLPREQRIAGVSRGTLLADGVTIALTPRSGHIQVVASVVRQPR
jgi:hypothetical protein